MNGIILIRMLKSTRNLDQKEFIKDRSKRRVEIFTSLQYLVGQSSCK